MADVGLRIDAIARLLSPSNPSTSLRALTSTDQEIVRALFHDDRAELFAPLGLPPPALTALLDQQLAAQRAGYARRYPAAGQWLIWHDNVPAGRLFLSPGAPSPGAEPTLLVLDLLIAKAARGRGIGTDVLTSLERAASAIGAARLELSVLQTNAGAQRLYRRLGYRVVTDGVYIVMVKPLAHPVNG